MKKYNARPNIPKLKITKVGRVINGKPDGNWAFDGKGILNSVGYYIDDQWELMGGYTVNELKQISERVS